MKLLKDYSFSPKKNDIFIVDSEGNIIYQIFSWGSKYIVNDEDIQNKLLDIEGYRGFVYSYKPPIIFPIIIMAIIIGIPIYFMKPNYDPQNIIVQLTLILYLISLILYYLKIRYILKDCKVL